MTTRFDPGNEELNDAITLAAWCSRSDAGYNIGAWQTALLLRDPGFRTLVAEEIARLDLPAEHPAVLQWKRDLVREAARS